MTEDEMVGWYHQLDGHEFELAPWVGDGQGSLTCCNPWGRKELDTTERLNGLNYYDYPRVRSLRKRHQNQGFPIALVEEAALKIGFLLHLRWESWFPPCDYPPLWLSDGGRWAGFWQTCDSEDVGLFSSPFPGPTLLELPCPAPILSPGKQSMSP